MVYSLQDFESYLKRAQKGLDQGNSKDEAHTKLLRDITRHPRELSISNQARFYAEVPFFDRSLFVLCEVDLIAIDPGQPQEVTIIEAKYERGENGLHKKLSDTNQQLKIARDTIKDQFGMKCRLTAVYRSGRSNIDKFSVYDERTLDFFLKAEDTFS